MADIVLFGVGEVAAVARFYLERFSEHRIVAHTVDAAYVRQESLDGLPVVAWENLESQFPPDPCSCSGL